MDSIRKWLYKPRRDDTSLFAQFFYADESLNLVAAELDSFDGRKDPERCSSLVNHLRQCQDKVLNICNRIMDELIPSERADRDFRVKFPDDVMQDNLAGQLWFGAECLAAGSSIMNRETESGAMRPLAKALTKSLENVRNLLREASLRTHAPTELAHDRLVESLKVFDRLLADFELCYVSAMVPVKSVHEYQLQQDVVVLFSETLQRALRLELLTQEMVDQYDPALMFTIPRLAIVTGLLVFPDGPLTLDSGPLNMSEMFRPFRTLLVKIRELLWTLSEEELQSLERMLCSSEDPVATTRKSSKPSSISEPDMSEEDNSCWGGEHETSECCTVMEHLPATQVPDQMSSLADDSGNGTLPSNVDNLDANITADSTREQSAATAPTTPDDEERNLEMELEEDNISEGASSSNFAQSGVFSLNGQWTLPVIPCACSSNLPEEGTMTKQGLMNRSLQQEQDFALDIPCEECMRQASDAESGEVPSNILSEAENQEDIRWLDRTEPSTSDSNENENNTCEVTNSKAKSDNNSENSVQCDSNLVSSDSNTHYKLNVNLSDTKISALRTIDGKQESKEDNCTRCHSGEASEDLHVRYAENWEALCSSGQLPNDCDNQQSSNPVNESLSTSCSSCHSTFSITPDSCSLTSDTSSFNSESQDIEEVALALQAVRDEARAKFRSSGDLLHRLFVCISGVADQLQTNFAGDLRHILKSVFLINSTDSKPEPEEETSDQDQSHDQEEESTTEDIPPELCENGEEALVWGANNSSPVVEAAPLWLPDEAAPCCMSCHAVFTVIRRRHHCRNCGKVFCARCSSNSVPLPRFGHVKPVRVCNRCFIYQVTPFSVESIPTS